MIVLELKDGWLAMKFPPTIMNESLARDERSNKSKVAPTVLIDVVYED